MKHKFKIITVILLSFYGGFAQFKNNVWCFGDSCGIKFNPVSTQVFTSSSLARGSCCSISDSSGNLLFYATTHYYNLWQQGYVALGVVYDRNNNLMQNGDTLIGEGWFQEQVIIPVPNADSLFYLFSVGETIFNGFYYSLVDITQNGNLGAVVQKNVQVNNFKATDCLNAMKHANGRDWWILFRRWDTANNSYYKYLVTPLGVSPPMIQNIGTSTDNGFMHSAFSKDGSKYMVVDYRGLIEVYNFDRCTGILNSVMTIEQEQPFPFPKYAACEFSKNGRFIYVTTTDNPTTYLYQFDLQVPNIAASKTLIGSVNSPSFFGYLQLAPDNKIYCASNYYDDSTTTYPYTDSLNNMYNENLSVINYPDSPGVACGFAPFSFYLGGNETYWGLPNNPDYDMGPITGSLCDSLSVCNPPTEGLKTINITTTTAQLKWKKYPNATGYKIRYRQPGLSWKYKTVFNNNGSKMISNLIPGKTYKWGVATICAPGDTSVYSVTKTFTTAAIRQAVYNAEPAIPVTKLTVHPNPAKDLFYLHFNSGNEEATIKLIDLTGKTLVTKTLTATDDEFNCNVNVSSLAPGLYCLIIYSGDEVITKKIIKE